MVEVEAESSVAASRADVVLSESNVLLPRPLEPPGVPAVEPEPVTETRCDEAAASDSDPPATRPCGACSKPAGPGPRPGPVGVLLRL